MRQIIVGMALGCAGLALGQVSPPAERLAQEPVFKVDVVARTTKAINYQHRSGATTIDFTGTQLSPKANGEAKVESKKGYIEIEVEFDELQKPSSFGPEYLTYVLWAITPEGRAQNLGELLVDGNRGKLNVTTDLQVFGLVVTAEPYFAVTAPSDVVILENAVRPDTRGRVEEVAAKYELRQRGEYSRNLRPESLSAFVPDGKMPLELVEARNAINIARGAEADRWATDTFDKAVSRLKQAEDYHLRKQQKPTVMTAREAVQTAEDARLIAVRRIDADRLAREREAAAQREADARARADEQAALRAQADQQRIVAEQQRATAVQDRLQADRQRADAERQKLLADSQRQAAMEQQQNAEKERMAAEQAMASAERERLEAEKQRTLADAQRQAAVEQQQSAERERLAAVQAKAEAEAARAAALEAQRQTQAEAEKARQSAQEANKLREQAERDKTELRDRLLQQLNSVLQTRASARGLIVNVSDVLFDTGQYNLKPGAREKLAKVAGIVASHPGLKLQVEGHTDSVGTDEFNQTLSDNRARSVREYLVQSGIPAGEVTSKGLGETTPVASNDTAAGRQQNRRVELVVSGQPVGIDTVDSRAITNQR